MARVGPIVLSSFLTATLVVGGLVAWTYWDRSVQAGDAARQEFSAMCQNLGSMSADEREAMLEILSVDEKRKLLVTIDECMKAV